MLKILCYKRFITIFVLIMLNGVFLISSCANSSIISNVKYVVEINENAELLVSSGDSDKFLFRPEFTVFHNYDDPSIALRPNSSEFIETSYNLPTWKIDKPLEDEYATKNPQVVGDGFDPRILEGDIGGRTENYYQCGSKSVLIADSIFINDKNIEWYFPDHPSFIMTASLTLPEDGGEPILKYEFQPKIDGFFSVGYTGAPSLKVNEVDEIYQSIIWQEKRFPDKPYLTMAFRCSLPTTLISKQGNTIGVIADPSEFPFMPLPLFENSRFGVAVRNDKEEIQTQIFAPVMGGLNSNMKKGDKFQFKVRLLVYKEELVNAFPKIAQEVYGFDNKRHNVLGSLNDALENMIEYGMSGFSRFNEELRGCEYSTDVPGSVKNVSSLNPLSIALVTDNKEIYKRRARPYIEYMLSREKFLFVTDPTITGQNPSWKLNGPCAPLSELTALYQMTNNNNPIFLDYAKELYTKERTLNLDTKVKGDNWLNSLALYRATMDKTYLAKTIKDASSYLEKRVNKRAENFRDPYFGEKLFFWTAFSPHWIGLTDLYEETKDKKFLEAAIEGVKRYSQFIWYSPMIPDEKVLVNKGNKAPHYWYLKSKGHEQMEIEEELVDAWRVSAIGLTPESSGTSSGHRGIMMTNPIPWMLRLSHYDNNKFLYDLSRSAVIGRWMNFPGYHINTGRTTVYEKADYPLRSHKELGYNSMHYNHIWPMMSMVLDYMVSDVFIKSDKKISFPGHFAEGYAYLMSKVYGDKPGNIYEYENVWLWMPKEVINVNNKELNYLTGYNKNKFIIVLTNQYWDNVESEVKLNEKVVPFNLNKEYKVEVWQENKKAEEAVLKNGRLKINTAGEGITVLVIDGIEVKPKFQNTFSSQKPLNESSYSILEYGKTHGMLMTIGEEYTTAYFYCQATFEDFEEVTFNYKIGDEWEKVNDKSYPFELTVQLPADRNKIEFYIDAVETDGSKSSSEKAILIK